MTAARKIDPQAAIRVARETLVASMSATKAALALLDAAEAGEATPPSERHTLRGEGGLTAGEFDAAVRRHGIPTFRVGKRVACRTDALLAALEGRATVRTRAPRPIKPAHDADALDERAELEAVGIKLRGARG